MAAISEAGTRGRQRTLLALLFTLGTVACSSAPPAGHTVGPVQTPGAQVFTSRCSVCHAPPHPKRHSYAEWELLLPVMEKRMEERGMGQLSDQDRVAILSYLKANGR
ncbi:MAG: cytochrome c [Thiogranum sp.]|jgi:cytochrome c5|nr:cytochrome c [Thiogranum sp.]